MSDRPFRKPTENPRPPGISLLTPAPSDPPTRTAHHALARVQNRTSVELSQKINNTQTTPAGPTPTGKNLSRTWKKFSPPPVGPGVLNVQGARPGVAPMRLVEEGLENKPIKLLPGMFFLYDGDFCLVTDYEMYFHFRTKQGYLVKDVNIERVQIIEVNEIKYSKV